MKKGKKIIIGIGLVIGIFFLSFYFVKRYSFNITKKLKNLENISSYSVRIVDSDDDKINYEINKEKKYIHYREEEMDIEIESFFLKEKIIDAAYSDTGLKYYFYTKNNTQDSKERNYNFYINSFQCLFKELSKVKYERKEKSFIKQLNNKKLNSALATLMGRSLEYTNISKVTIREDKEKNINITFDCKGKIKKYVLYVSLESVSGVLPKTVTDSLEATSFNSFSGVYTNSLKCENKTLQNKLVLNRFSISDGYSLNYELFLDCSSTPITVDEDFYEVNGTNIDYLIPGTSYHFSYKDGKVSILDENDKVIETLKKNYSPSQNFIETSVETFTSFDYYNHAIVYFGSDDYEKEKDYLSTLIKVQNELNTDIYYINVDKLSKEDKELLRKKGIILSTDVRVSVGYNHYLDGEHKEKELKEFIEKYNEK